jgi:flagella basal body P-ring formation protein FlgA
MSTMTRFLLIALAASSAIVRADEIAEPTPNVAANAARREARVVEDRVRIAAIELRNEATVNDASVTLRQICRWPEADEPTFAPYAELIVARLPASQSFATLSLDGIRGTLRDAGLNPARVNFSGAATCTVNRSDVTVDEGAALRAWSGEAAKPEVVRKDPAPQGPAWDADVADLKSKLIADVATRLKLPIDSLQVDFRPEDRKLLSMGSPFEFTIETQRLGDLGDVSWLVTVSGDGAKPQAASNVGGGRRVRIAATARAWMEQLVPTRAIATREPIGADDVAVHRVLADRMPNDPWLTKQQVVGQQATRDLRPGITLTGRMVTPVELVRPGQLVTVLSRRGAVEVKSIARAMQAGALGQAVRVKNETTGEIFVVTMTAKQTATMGDGAPSVAEAR